MEALARAADRELRIYMVGGTTAVLMGWRSSTIDVDLVMRPEDDALLRAIPAIKERLQVNIELASPLDFIPVLPGWEDRSPLVVRIGQSTFALRKAEADCVLLEDTTAEGLIAADSATNGQAGAAHA